MKKEKQIKSKKRVKDLGEVFTNEREVKAMVDLIPNISVETTFLEPTCGTGNFLVEILKRKINLFVGDKKSEDYLNHISQCYNSIYGIDIMEDNITETKNRLLNMLPQEAKTISSKISNILNKNIRVGDFLQITGVDLKDKPNKIKEQPADVIKNKLQKFFTS